MFVAVRDDGVGFESDHLREGLGLHVSIRDRLAAVGGWSDVRRAPGRGRGAAVSTAQVTSSSVSASRTTLATEIPSSSNTTSPGALAPNRSIPTLLSA